MDVILLGVVHDDPLCRPALAEWLRLAKNDRGEPCFVAIEWDESHFDSVRLQRDEFGRMCSERWPGAEAGELDALAMSLGFEGDTHTDSFPDAKVLWLDVGREVFPPDAVTRFGARRLCVFESFVLQTERDNASDFFSLCGSKAAINFLSTTAHLLAEAGRREWPDPRDEKWAQMISHAAEECASNSWGAVVVGFRHTEMNDDMLGGMLRARGIDVTASSLPLHP